MTLNPVDFDFESVQTPAKIAEFLSAVNGLVEQNRVDTAKHFRGFVPSDYGVIFRCLKSIFDSQLLTGCRFCEWGSGVSVVASLAGMIGYESYGIEYDRKLCSVGEGICAEFNVPVELVHGSFIPEGVEDLINDAFANYDGELALHTDTGNAYKEMDYDIKDFDLVFAYPWPNDLELIYEIFDRCAAPGSLLLTYFDHDSIALNRKA